MLRALHKHKGAPSGCLATVITKGLPRDCLVFVVGQVIVTLSGRTSRWLLHKCLILGSKDPTVLEQTSPSLLQQNQAVRAAATQQQSTREVGEAARTIEVSREKTRSDRVRLRGSHNLLGAHRGQS